MRVFLVLPLTVNFPVSAPGTPEPTPEESPLAIWQRVWRAATMRQRRELLAWLPQQALLEAAESQEVWP
jgi:hypothetical protein